MFERPFAFTLPRERETALTTDAVILPFRRKGTRFNDSPPVRRGYVVKGRYERHRRKFNIWANDDIDAIDVATTLVSWYAHNSGPFSELVWQKGDLQLYAVDGYRFISTIEARPRPLSLVSPTAKRKKRDV